MCGIDLGQFINRMALPKMLPWTVWIAPRWDFAQIWLPFLFLLLLPALSLAAPPLPDTYFDSEQQLLEALQFNSQPIYAVAFSVDGRRVAMAKDQRIHIFDTRTGNKLHILQGHHREVISIAFAADGKRLLSGSWDNTVRLWDTDSGSLLHTLRGHENRVTSVAFAIDGKQLLSGSSDNTLRLWDTDTGNLLRTLQGHEDSVISVAFATDGKRLLSGSRDQTLRLWDADSGNLLHTLQGGQVITSVAFAVDGKRLLSGSSDGILQLWDADNGSLLHTLQGHEEWVSSVAFVADGKQLLSGSWDNTLRLWDADSGSLLHTLQGHKDWVTSVALAADDKRLLSVSDDGTIREWDALTGQALSVRLGTWVGWEGAKAEKNYWVYCDLTTLGCHRRDDGSLLNADLPPQATTRLLLELPDDLQAAQDETTNFQLKVHNVGQQPVYWVKLRLAAQQERPLTCPGQKILPDSSFVINTPNTVLSLASGKSSEIPIELTAQTCFEQPQAGIFNLALEVVAHNAPTQIIHTSLHIDLPQLLSPVPVSFQKETRTLLVSLHNEGKQALNDSQIQLLLNNHPIGDPILSKQLAANATRDFSFIAPKAMKLNKNSRVTLYIRKTTAPIHAWYLRDLLIDWRPFMYPHEIVLLLLGVLMLAVLAYYLRLFRHPLVLELSAEPVALLHVPFEDLPRARRYLHNTRRLDTVLSNSGVPDKFLQKAEQFEAMEAMVRADLLARRWGADVVALPVLAQEGIALFSFTLPATFPLNLDTLLLYFPPPDAAQAEIEGCLNRLTSTEKILILSLDTVQQTALRPLGIDPATLWIVPDNRDITALLISPQPVQVLVSLLASQLKVAQLSPYQTRSGVNKDLIFFGRSQLLSHILHREAGNYLLCGGRQVGKSSILKRLHRYYQDRPEVDCHYLLLSGADFWSKWQGEQAGDLAAVSSGQRRVVLIDEADLFIRAEAQNDYPTLQVFRSLSEEGRCFFILAGFWDLYAASVLDYHSPLKNFGESLTIGALEAEACRQLAIEPMANLGLHYADSTLVDRLLEKTGQRANLIAIVCNEMLKKVRAEQRILTASALEQALDSDALRDSLQDWATLSSSGEDSDHRLDRLLVYATIEMGEFDMKSAMEALNAAGVEYRVEALKKSLARLVLAFVLERAGKGRYRYHVPLLKDFILEDDVRSVLAHEAGV